MRYFFLTTILGICICISSCFDYRKTNRRHHLVKTEYNKLNRVVIKNALICANTGGFKIKPLEINRDSILNLFIDAFKKLPCNFKFVDGKLYCNRGFIGYESLKYRLFDFNELKSLVGDEENHVLIPIINYNYIPTRNIYLTSTGAVGGGGFSKNVHLELAILVFKNKELVYFQSRVFCSPIEQTTFSTDNIDFSIKQENIDTLVQLTMKDYIDRMK